ncbi:MAG: hypothetical protein R3F05_08425 [Planctomycetota bacterium]
MLRAGLGPAIWGQGEHRVAEARAQGLDRPRATVLGDQATAHEVVHDGAVVQGPAAMDVDAERAHRS